MARLQRVRGHLYNWYDTRDLRPLEPAVRIHGRQRQSRRASDRARQRLPGLARSAPRCGAAPERRRGRARPGPRGMRPVARRPPDPDRDAALSSTTRWRPSLADLRQASLSKAIVGAARRPCAPMSTSWSTSPARSRSNGTTEPSADLLLWARAVSSCDREPSPGSRAAGGGGRAPSGERLAVLEGTAPVDGAGDGVRLPARSRPTAAVDRLSGQRRPRSIRTATICWPPRRGSPASSPSPRATSPARHWFRLGRSVTPVAHGAALISWSGSMFEYLMPSLVMRAPAGSLLEQTNRLIVRRQIAYGAKLGMPWGISESAYNARDLEFTYQYSNFGVPGLGLKRGLGEERSSRPTPRRWPPWSIRGRRCEFRAAGEDRARTGATASTRRWTITPGRVPEGQSVAIVHAFMAHHQGMTIVAIADALLDGADAGAVPCRADRPGDRTAAAGAHAARRRGDPPSGRGREVGGQPPQRRSRPAAGASPRPSRRRPPRICCRTAAIRRCSPPPAPATAAGAIWRVTRWREDATCDDCGFYIYLQGRRAAGDVWSAGFQPTRREAGRLRRRSSTRIAPSSRAATAR